MAQAIYSKEINFEKQAKKCQGMNAFVLQRQA
jgi:hypothetical protein